MSGYLETYKCILRRPDEYYELGNDADILLMRFVDARTTSDAVIQATHLAAVHGVKPPFIVSAQRVVIQFGDEEMNDET